MSPEPAQVRKRRLRAAARALDEGASESAALRAQQRLLELPELRGVPTVSLYAGLGHEVPTDTLALTLRERGIRLVFPRMAGRELQLVAAEGLAQLETGPRGILEPGADGPTVSIEEVPVFVVPGLLFDRAGRRLGRGEGCYDRLLGRAHRDAFRIGLCYAHRVVSELPAADGDVPMHVVVTDTEVIRPGDDREQT